MPEKVKALFIFEILGRPPEHIKKSLGELIYNLGNQKGIQIIRKKIHEPKKLEENDKKGKVVTGEDFFTTFAEVELIADNIDLVSTIVLNMLPAHIEIIEPSEYKFNNFELSSFLTDLAVKIHKYDEIAKVLMFERQNLLDKLRESENRIRELENKINEK